MFLISQLFSDGELFFFFFCTGSEKVPLLKNDLLALSLSLLSGILPFLSNALSLRALSAYASWNFLKRNANVTVTMKGKKNTSSGEVSSLPPALEIQEKGSVAYIPVTNRQSVGCAPALRWHRINLINRGFADA